MEHIFLFIIIISPFLLIATYIITIKSHSFLKILMIHSLVFLIYTIFVINYSKILLGHDEYGLGQLVLGIMFIVLHIGAGFIHAVVLNIKHKQTNLLSKNK